MGRKKKNSTSVLGKTELTPIEKIKIWLNGPQDYKEGMQIFIENSKKFKLISHLLRIENSHNKARLAYEMRSLIKRLECK